MSKKIIYFLIALIIFLTTTSLLIGWPVITIYNNYKTSRFLNSLENIKLPENTTVVNSSKLFGIITPSGNHCDCFIAIVLESHMSLETFSNYEIDTSILAFPYSEKEQHLAMKFYVKGDQLFLIHKGEVRELVNTNESRYSIKDVNTDTFPVYPLEMREYQSLKELIKDTSQKESKNYYIITAIDQTFSGVSMKDMRCH